MLYLHCTMKSIIILISLLLPITTYAAWSADHFIVKIGTNPAKTNEAIDITVQAVDKNSDIIKWYEWDVFIEVEWLSSKDVTLPNDGVYTFVPEDQWSKIFSKWLVFKKEWEFRVKVVEIADEKKVWYGSILVKWSTNWSSMGDIVVSSPTSWWTEVSSTINVIATTTKPNSPYELSIWGAKVKEGLTNADGSINIYLENIADWPQVLSIKILDIDGKTLAELPSHPFIRKAPDLNLLKSIKFIPGQKVSTSQMITAILTTASSVSSAQLNIWSKTYILDKSKDWEFKKDFKVTVVGTYPMTADLTSEWNQTSYKLDGALEVTQSDAMIKEVKVSFEDTDPTKATLRRQVAGQFSSYKVLYWLTESTLTQSITSNATMAKLSLKANTVYYAQVVWLDVQWQSMWRPSQIVRISPSHNSADWNWCIVDNIIISAKKEWWRSYLSRNPIQDIEKYTVYQSSVVTKDLSSMTKIWETVINQFEYPFDANAKQKEYLYYTVIWQCKDGRITTVWDATKIQVGPWKWILYTLCFWVFVFAGRKLMSV